VGCVSGCCDCGGVDGVVCAFSAVPQEIIPTARARVAANDRDEIRIFTIPPGAKPALPQIEQALCHQWALVERSKLPALNLHNLAPVPGKNRFPCQASFSGDYIQCCSRMNLISALEQKQSAISFRAQRKLFPKKVEKKHPRRASIKKSIKKEKGRNVSCGLSKLFICEISEISGRNQRPACPLVPTTTTAATVPSAAPTADSSISAAVTPSARHNARSR